MIRDNFHVFIDIPIPAITGITHDAIMLSLQEEATGYRTNPHVVHEFKIVDVSLHELDMDREPELK
jgi:uncharacterized protein YrrD